MTQSHRSSIDLRSYIAQGWTILFILFVSNLVMDMARCQVTGGCQVWADHLGYGGVVFVTCVMVVYALVPLLVRSVKGNWIRYATIPLSAMITMFYIAHQLSHLASGDKPMGLIHALDFTHHFIGVTVFIASIMWVRQLRKQPADHASSENETTDALV